MFARILSLDLPKGQSCFLWGARKTGKSTFLQQHFPDSVIYDFLKSDVYLRYTRNPSLFREEILSFPDSAFEHPIVLDEVQKIPLILDEVHWLIENTPAYFILCGSSARKLKRGGANLLGGRAWKFEFFPLVYKEIPNFDLQHALKNGMLPAHYEQKDATRSLRGYVEDYIKEEIQAEGIIRQIPAFARFLDIVALSHGEMVNYKNISRECGVDAKTVKNYYQILSDTLIGYFVYPFSKVVKREVLIATPKFYLFDTGVAQYLSRHQRMQLSGLQEGKAFEHFILMEIMAYQGVHEIDHEVQYWRTKTGLEVDFILRKGEVAIEVKFSKEVIRQQVKGLIAYSEEHKPAHAVVVSDDMNERLLCSKLNIRVMPWRTFLDKLWDGYYSS